MIKVTFYINEPRGKPRKKFLGLGPGLGRKHGVQIEYISHPREYYLNTKEGIPIAPAVMINEEVITEGEGIEKTEIISAIVRHQVKSAAESSQNSFK